MILGLLRVRNEGRWIERCLNSILPLCDHIFVFDDHSTDDTFKICSAMPKVKAYRSPFAGLNESRDKNFILERALELKPDWILAIDGDEMLAPGYEGELRDWMTTQHQCLSLRVLYLWNSETQVRFDGVYGDFHRESVFRPNGSRFTVSEQSANFHCGNVPWGNRQKRKVLGVPLLHFGYMHREDRIRKWEFYNSNDPQNRAEGYDPKWPQRGSYPHIIQGDSELVPANAVLMHGGPLQLGSLSDYAAHQGDKSKIQREPS